MVTINRVVRDDIDCWSVSESGLPIRVVNSVRHAGVHTIGQLRAWSDPELLRLRSLGRTSVQNIHTFFETCKQIEQGVQKFPSINDILHYFLDNDERVVLNSRYGLDHISAEATRSQATLQEIGNACNKTRERIRQIEETGKEKMRSRLADVCLQPFYRTFVSRLHEQGGGATCKNLQSLTSDPVMSGLNPCGLLLLLCDLNPKTISFYNGIFSTFPLEALKELETRAVDVMRFSHEPVTAADLYKNVQVPDSIFRSSSPQYLLGILLEMNDETGALRDGRYFNYQAASVTVLDQLMASMGTPSHYRRITEVFNENLKPNNGKGAGFILDCLNSSSQFRKVDRGVYVLSPSTVPTS